MPKHKLKTEIQYKVYRVTNISGTPTRQDQRPITNENLVYCSCKKPSEYTMDKLAIATELAGFPYVIMYNGYKVQQIQLTDGTQDKKR